MPKQRYWIKERHNPQLGVYYVAMGQMTAKAAGDYERGSLYGNNIMHPFATEDQYTEELQMLRKRGEKVQ